MEFDKKQYWKNRKEGMRGQGETPSLIVGAKPSGVSISFTNSGELIASNRAYRRRRVTLPTTMQKSKTKRKKK